VAIFDADPVPRLFFSPAPPAAKDSGGSDSPGSRPSPPHCLALHPGSGSEKKNWPEAKWADLLEHLIATTGFHVLLVGGEAEGERLQRLAAALPPTRLRVAQSLPLPDLARGLARCVAFVGHDSGISHLAAAVGLPGLVLWGDTVEEIWRPPSRKVMVLRHPEGLANLSVENVAESLREMTKPLTLAGL
jgi:heptosyltransferase-2